jgi:hypothetical protein
MVLPKAASDSTRMAFEIALFPAPVVLPLQRGLPEFMSYFVLMGT